MKVAKFFARRVLRLDVPTVRLPALMAAPERIHITKSNLVEVEQPKSYSDYDRPAKGRFVSERVKRIVPKKDERPLPMFFTRQAD